MSASALAERGLIEQTKCFGWLGDVGRDKHPNTLRCAGRVAYLMAPEVVSATGVTSKPTMLCTLPDDELDRTRSGSVDIRRVFVPTPEQPPFTSSVYANEEGIRRYHKNDNGG